VKPPPGFFALAKFNAPGGRPSVSAQDNLLNSSIADSTVQFFTSMELAVVLSNGWLPKSTERQAASE